MKLRNVATTLIVTSALAASACSKKSTGGADGGACSIDESSTATVVEIVNRSESALCPNLDPDALSGGDAGPGECAPQVDVDQCSFEVSCQVGGADIEGSGSVSGDEVTVSVTATIVIGSTSVECAYDLTGRVE